MIPAWVILWAKERAWPWLLLHWKDVAVGLVILLAWLLARQGAKLSACEAALAAKPETTLTQSQASSSTAKVSGDFTIKPGAPRPCPALGECPPCPEIEVHFGAEAASTQAQSQTETAAPSQAQNVQLQRRLDFWLASSMQGQVSAGGRLDLWRVGPAVVGAGFENPVSEWAPKVQVNIGFPLAWPLN